MVSSSGNLRALLGFGSFVQGFRGFPWMGVNFFLKDVLNVDSPTLQLLQNSANIPMVGKPLYGIVSDVIYFRGQHRIPYIAIGAFLQAVSWLAIALLPLSDVPIITISMFLLLSNLGASIVEVANDALVAETGKQVSSAKNSQSSSSSTGELQSFVWMAASIGGVLGNILGGIAVERFSAQTMFLAFGLLLIIQFFTTVSVNENSLNLPRKPSNSGIRKQFKELSLALQKPEIAYSLAWFALSNAIIPVLTGTMFFYQTQHLQLDSSVLGLSKVFGQAAMLLWSMIYNKRLKLIPPRKLISAIQATMVVFMLSDVLFVKEIYRNLGMPDSVYVVIFSGLLEVLFQFKVLPFSVLMAQLCPPGCEGSLMAFLMSSIALSSIVSGYLGVLVASYVGVSGDNFEGLPHCILIQAACTLMPLFWSSWIPNDVTPQKKKNKTEKQN